ncbi:hypothetical protein AA0121_g9704 [Alternaria tenuissima]|nr:hypothetical protein AA0121_g9704 [Alternaria tenuissima]
MKINRFATAILVLPFFTATAVVLNIRTSPTRLTGNSFGIPAQNSTFDYVIIGGGTAGSVVAARLVEDSNVSVAVIEAGGYADLVNGNLSRVPGYSDRFEDTDGGDWESGNRQPGIDWGFVSEPEVALGGRKIHEAQGRNLGGSSVRNALIYHRGTYGSYAQWAAQVGDDSFQYDNMQQYFERSINFNTSNLHLREANASVTWNPNSYNRQDGPLQLSFPSFGWPFSTHASNAFSSIGMNAMLDHNSGHLDGHAWVTFTQSPDGVRSSAETSFLSQAFQTAGLTAFIQSRATKILFDEQQRATGVRADFMGLEFDVFARKEVIVAAGAVSYAHLPCPWMVKDLTLYQINSPKLLMLSGIGASSTLQQHNIPVRVELPGVGQNMWNSAQVGGILHEVPLATTALLDNSTFAAEQESLYNEVGAGMLTNSGPDYIGWEKVPAAQRDALGSIALGQLSAFADDWPELEYLAINGAALPNAKPGRGYAGFGVTLVAALSRGNVTLASANPFDDPIIHLNFLQEETDRRVAIAGYKRMRQAWAAVPEHAKGVEMFPGEAVQTDEQLWEAIQLAAAPSHHISATCNYYYSATRSLVVTVADTVSR